VRSWAADPPTWVEILETHGVNRGFVRLGEGEAAVIALAELLHADLLLMDERKGVKVARSKGLRVTGTLGLLDMAAQAGLADFAQAAERLRRTTFRSPDALIELMLKRHGKKGDV
jgi:predicted nucleic acid-binding protein